MKATAVENRRSLNQQIIVCLEWCKGQTPRPKPAFPRPLALNGGLLSLTDIDAAKKAGRKGALAEVFRNGGEVVSKVKLS